MAFLAYQTPATVATKVGAPTAIPMILELSSPEELGAVVGSGLEDEVEADEGAGLEDDDEAIFCVEVAGAAEPLDGEVMEALANAAGSGYSVM